MSAAILPHRIRESELFLFCEDVGGVFAGDGFGRSEAEFGEVDTGEEVFALAEEDGGDGEVHLVDLICGQVLANGGDAASDADVLAVGCFFGLLESGAGAFGDEVEGGASFHDEGRPCVMGEDVDGRVIGGIVAPPAFPGVAVPWAADRAEHIAAEDPGADIFERLKSEVVIDALAATALALHLLEDFGVEKPGVQLHAADAEGIVEVLVRAGAEPVERDGKCSYFNFAH